MICLSRDVRMWKPCPYFQTLRAIKDSALPMVADWQTLTR